MYFKIDLLILFDLDNLIGLRGKNLIKIKRQKKSQIAFLNLA